MNLTRLAFCPRMGVTSAFIYLADLHPRGGVRSDGEGQKECNSKNVTAVTVKALFLSRTVKSESFYCAEIICVLKKLLEVQKAHLYKNYYTFSLLPVKRSEGLAPINGKTLLRSTT